MSTHGVLSATALLRWQFRLAHELLDAVIDRLTTQAAHWRPPGPAPTAGASYPPALPSQDPPVHRPPPPRPPPPTSPHMPRCASPRVTNRPARSSPVRERRRSAAPRR